MYAPRENESWKAVMIASVLIVPLILFGAFYTPDASSQAVNQPAIITNGLLIEPDAESGIRWDDPWTTEISSNAVTKIVFRPLRHQTWEPLTSIRWADDYGTMTASWGPFQTSELELLSDGTGWGITIDTRNPDPVDGSPFQPWTQTVSFEGTHPKMERNGDIEEGKVQYQFYLRAGPK